MRTIVRIGSEYVLLKEGTPITIIDALEGARPVKRTYNNGWELANHEYTPIEVIVIGGHAASVLLAGEKKEAETAEA